MITEATTYFSSILSEVAEEQRVSDAVSVSPIALPSAPAVSQISDGNENDEQLLAQVALGSRDALGHLFRRHGRSIFNVAWRILRDRSEADDLRQDVFLYLFHKAKQFDATKGSAASWIIQVTYHRAIDRRRFLSSRQHYTSEVLNDEWMPVKYGQLSTDAIDGKAIRSRLNEQLSEDQRSTLELHFFEGHSLREIAELRGQTVGNVRHHYYRALERLRSCVFPEKHA